MAQDLPTNISVVMPNEATKGSLGPILKELAPYLGEMSRNPLILAKVADALLRAYKAGGDAVFGIKLEETP